MRPVWASVFFLLGSLATAQVTITPLFTGSVTTQVRGSETASWSPVLTEPEAVVEGGTEWEVGSFRGQVLGGLRLGERFRGGTLSQAWASWGEDGPVSIRAGWWPEPTGPALFHSLYPTFSVVSGTDFLASAGTAVPRSPAKGRITANWGEFKLSAEVLAEDPPLPLPDPGSLWFPRKDLPTGLEYWGQTIRLSQLSVVDGNQGSEQPRSWRTEVRWSAIWGDLTTGFYQGKDTAVVYPYQLTILPSYEEFQLTLLARRNTVQTGWATMEVPLGPGKFWMEQKITRGRLRVAPGWDPDHPGELIQATSTSNVWEGVFGASVSVSMGPWGTLRTWTEGSLYRDGSDPGRAAPDFSEGWEAGLLWDEAKGLANVSVIGGTPWDPKQGWLWVRGTWTGLEGKTLWVGVPFFWGGNGSTWGQFADRKVIALGTSYQW